MKLLRQNTQTILDIGPILGTDFLTPQTGVTLSTNHAELFQAGSTSAIDISGRTFSHISNGIYQLTLTVSDLSVVGPTLLHIHPASCQPLKVDGNVLQQPAYDALCGGGNMPSNVNQIFGSSNAASNLEQGALGLIPVTIQSGATTTVIPTNLTSAISQFYNGRTLLFITGALAGQAAAITGYNGATKQLTVSAMTTAPSNNDTAVII